ncbi:rolling circle replication-associated protein [Sphingobacterium multivorum]|uniref:rolling circle replication-associated protein n=1 Tax=Sphingobacterium multivorum TaxID=28454 RepID=UPI000E838E55|nr:hypothetical protein [Sphingobacterium multivorum]HAF33275.1 hypothetical protein [Sphingobacterium sp.]HBI89193.1 hypothetical protein [Sphingobacterium sp.]
MARKKTLTSTERRNNDLNSKRNYINNRRKEEKLVEAINNYFEYGTTDKKLIKLIQKERLEKQNTIDYQEGLVNKNINKEYNGFFTMTFNNSQINYRRGIFSVRKAIEKFFKYLMDKKAINRFFCVFELTKDFEWHAHAVINICNPLITNHESYLRNAFKFGLSDYEHINDMESLEIYLKYMVKRIYPIKNNLECLYWFENDLLTHLSDKGIPKRVISYLNKILVERGIEKIITC